MKKKLLTLFLVVVLVLSNFAVSFAGTLPDPLLDAAEKKSGTEALAAATDGTGIIIDVRAQERHASAHLDSTVHNYVSLPLFTVNADTDSNVPTTLNDGLSDAFNNYVEENKTMLEGKKIYILCNSGATGAKNGTNLLAANGLTENVFTIENGAKNLDILKAMTITYASEHVVSNEKAVEIYNNPEANPDAVFIDVRAKVRYDAGHLKGAISLPLFTVDANDKNVATTLFDDEAAAFTKYVTDNADTLKTKDIYIICNSGKTGVVNAAKLLLNAGYSMQNQINMIEGGGTGAAMVAAQTFVSADQALSVMGNDDYLIVDVRADKRYDAGHLEGSIHLPLFTVDANDKNIVTTRDDELSKAFNEYVTANKDKFNGKKIYLLCNGGQSGAAAGTYLLGELEKAGVIKTAGVYTIEGGANNNPSIQAAFVTEKEVPKTADTNTMVPYVLLLCGALACMTVANKRRFER